MKSIKPSYIPLFSSLKITHSFLFSFVFPIFVFPFFPLSIHYLFDLSPLLDSYTSFPSLVPIHPSTTSHIFARAWPSHCDFQSRYHSLFFSILPLLSHRGMRQSWCTLHWLISATWPWPRPWRWDLGGIPMGLLAQAKLSQSKPSAGCLDAKCWCLTVMRYKDAFREYLNGLTSITLTL